MSSSKARFFNPAVVGLIMLSFFLGTSEYTVIGILPEIADGFGISPVSYTHLTLPTNRQV